MHSLEKIGEDRLRAASALARSQIELCGRTSINLPFGTTPSDYLRAFRRVADQKQI